MLRHCGATCSLRARHPGPWQQPAPPSDAREKADAAKADADAKRSAALERLKDAEEALKRDLEELRAGKQEQADAANLENDRLAAIKGEARTPCMITPFTNHLIADAAVALLGHAAPGAE